MNVKLPTIKSGVKEENPVLMGVYYQKEMNECAGEESFPKERIIRLLSEE